jgi:hypothetical protein
LGWCRQQRSWLIPAVALFCLLVPLLVANALVHTPHEKHLHGWLLVVGVISAAFIVGSVVSAVCLIRNGSQAWQARRRAHGHLSPTEQATAARQREAQLVRDQASDLLAQLAAGSSPVAGGTWDVVLAPGERVLLDDKCVYERFYETTAPYVHSTTTHYGNVGSVTALIGHGLDRAANESRRDAALSRARPQWRERQTTRVLATDRRLFVRVGQQGWQNFRYTTATALAPDVERQMIVFESSGSSPLRLSGPAALRIAVIAVWAVHGPTGLIEHPALSALRPAEMALKQSPQRDPAEVERLALSFVAAHELVLDAQFAALSGLADLAERQRVIDRLLERGLLERVRFVAGGPVAYRLSAAAIAWVDPALPALSELDFVSLRRWLLAPWIWLRARDGQLGNKGAMVLSRRELMGAVRRQRSEETGAVPAALLSAAAHQTELELAPDVLTVDSTGWTTFHLQLAMPDQDALLAMAGRFARDPMHRRSYVFADQPAIAEAVTATVARAGLSDRVEVQQFDAAYV